MQIPRWPPLLATMPGKMWSDYEWSLKVTEAQTQYNTLTPAWIYLCFQNRYLFPHWYAVVFGNLQKTIHFRFYSSDFSWFSLRLYRFVSSQSSWRIITPCCTISFARIGIKSRSREMWTTIRCTEEHYRPSPELLKKSDCDDGHISVWPRVNIFMLEARNAVIRMNQVPYANVYFPALNLIISEVCPIIFWGLSKLWGGLH